MFRYNFFPTPISGTNPLAPSIEQVKDYLYITNNERDTQLTSIVKGCISRFESSTNFLVRAGEIDLFFNYDKYLSSDGSANILNFAITNIDLFTSDSLSDLYFQTIPLSCNIASGKPLAFSFFDYETSDFYDLTDAELTALPDNFLTVFNSFPLQFRIRLGASAFDDRIKRKKFKMKIRVPVTAIDFSTTQYQDIEQCIIRLASMLYDNPTSDGMINDTFCASVISAYQNQSELVL